MEPQAAVELGLLPSKAAKLVATLGPVMDPASRKFGAESGIVGLPALHYVEALQLVGRAERGRERALAVLGCKWSLVQIQSPRPFEGRGLIHLFGRAAALRFHPSPSSAAN
jgi:hypothetical protein